MGGGAWPGGKAGIWVDSERGSVCCSGGWQAWRVVETGAVCLSTCLPGWPGRWGPSSERPQMLPRAVWVREDWDWKEWENRRRMFLEI